MYNNKEDHPTFFYDLFLFLLSSRKEKKRAGHENRKEKKRWRKKTYLALHQKEKRDSYIFMSLLHTLSSVGLDSSRCSSFIVDTYNSPPSRLTDTFLRRIVMFQPNDHHISIRLINDSSWSLLVRCLTLLIKLIKYVILKFECVVCWTCSHVGWSHLSLFSSTSKYK